jgi:peptidoglycan/xylan/chitin deacetylase (PgdA/CDA1 family)
VVLTFDDGPWPKNTQAVLAALAAHCTKAIFFPIGLHATYEPGIGHDRGAMDAGESGGSTNGIRAELNVVKNDDANPTSDVRFASCHFRTHAPQQSYPTGCITRLASLVPSRYWPACSSASTPRSPF